jgi:hypothetical protein
MTLLRPLPFLLVSALALACGQSDESVDTTTAAESNGEHSGHDHDPGPAPGELYGYCGGAQQVACKPGLRCWLDAWSTSGSCVYAWYPPPPTGGGDGHDHEGGGGHEGGSGGGGGGGGGGGSDGSEHEHGGH